MPTSKDRPGAWNDDVIWLLERLGGLLGSQGKGTDRATLPLGGATSPVVHYIRLTPTGLAAAAVVSVQLPTTTRQWRLLSAQFHSVAGSATTWAPHIGQTAAFAIDGPDDRLGLTSQAFATPYRKAFCTPVPFKADASGLVYIQPQLDVGADNDLDLQLWFIQDFETEEST